MNAIFRFVTVSMFCKLLLSCGGVPEQRPSMKSLAFDSVEGSSASPRRLCVFMDGTSNDHDSRTHIRHLYEVVSNRRDPQTICFYDSGVGAEKFIVTGMIGGAGFSSNVCEAYAFLAAYYRPGDKIYIFGYSRGARQAMVLCDMIDMAGLPKLQVPASKSERRANVRAVRPVLVKYKEHWKKLDREYWDRAQAKLDRAKQSLDCKDLNNSADIEFLGLFDNVDSLMFPVVRTWPKWLKSGGEPVPYARHSDYGYHLPPNVKRSYHAGALDEKRGYYQLIPWIVPEDHSQDYELVWFPGSHGDVGGSYDMTKHISQHALRWMLKKMAIVGLISDLDVNIPVPPSQALARDSRKIFIMNLIGNIRLDRVRRDSLGGVFWSCKHPTKKPFIHQSVIDRIEAENVPLFGKNSVNYEIYRPEVFFDRKPNEVKLKCKSPTLKDQNIGTEELIAWILQNFTIVPH